MTIWTEFFGQNLIEKNPAKPTREKRKAMFPGETGNCLSFLYATGIIPVVKIDPDMGLLRLVFVKGQQVRVRKPFLWSFDLHNYRLKIKRNKRDLQIWVPLFRRVTSFAADSLLRTIDGIKTDMTCRPAVSIDSARRETSLIGERDKTDNRSFLARKSAVREMQIDQTVNVSGAIAQIQVTPDMAAMAAIELRDKTSLTERIRARHTLLAERSIA